MKPQSFHTPATLACCHLVIMTKLQNASFKCETGQQSVTMNGLFKHRLHTSGSALTTETCVELKLHMRGVYRTGNHLSDHPRLKLKDCFKKIIKCAVSTYSRSTKAWLKNAAVWHSRWKPCLLHYTFVPAVYMTKFKGAVHPKIKNTYFSLTCSVVYPSRVLEISAVELSALMI